MCQPPNVGRLGYLDVLKAAKTYSTTNASDPFIRYLRNDRPQSPSQRLAEKASISLYLMVCMRTRTALTVGHGRANVVGIPPRRRAVYKNHLTEFLEDLRVIVKRRRDELTSDLERRRLIEFEDKMARTVHEYLGNYVDDMWYIEGLCTHPSRQKRGYGGALLESIAAMADAEFRTCWLQSSNIENTKFYTEHGFVPITTVTVGEGDPTWHGQPVVITIMIRTPNSKIY